MGIDNKVGLIIKSEAQKNGGELSAQQSSEIRVKAVSEGLMTGDENKYEAYLRCILELDKRRDDRKLSELLERVQQPTLKVYLASPKQKSDDRFARRLVIENTGEELTELEVTPAPFLYLSDLCVARVSSDCQDDKFRTLQMSYIPVRNYYSIVTSRGRYKGELYSIDEDAPSKLKDVVHDFEQKIQSGQTGSMNDYVITLVRIRYKDKFQNVHERFIDVTLEQRELPANLGQALFDMREEWMKSNMMIDARHTSFFILKEIWNKTSRSMNELPAPWLKYRSIRGQG